MKNKFELLFNYTRLDQIFKQKLFVLFLQNYEVRLTKHLNKKICVYHRIKTNYTTGPNIKNILVKHTNKNILQVSGQKKTIWSVKVQNKIQFGLETSQNIFASENFKKIFQDHQF